MPTRGAAGRVSSSSPFCERLYATKRHETGLFPGKFSVLRHCLDFRSHKQTVPSRDPSNRNNKSCRFPFDASERERDLKRDAAPGVSHPGTGHPVHGNAQRSDALTVPSHSAWPTRAHKSPRSDLHSRWLAVLCPRREIAVDREADRKLQVLPMQRSTDDKCNPWTPIGTLQRRRQM